MVTRGCPDGDLWDLLRRTADECGTTQLAGKSIATPFVGGFVGAILFALTFFCGREGADSFAYDVNNL